MQSDLASGFRGLRVMCCDVINGEMSSRGTMGSAREHPFGEKGSGLGSLVMAPWFPE